MLINEWPLLVFTLLAQAGTGCFLVSRMYPILPKQLKPTAFQGPQRSALFLSLIVLWSAALFSFFHLGRPDRAYLAANQILSSWLSREIFLLLWVLAGLSILLFFPPAKNQKSPFRVTIEIVTGIGGLLLIWAMARLYMLATVPVWNTAATPLSFYLTAFIIGGTAYFVLSLRSSFEKSVRAYNLAGFIFVSVVLQTGVFSLWGPGWGLFAEAWQVKLTPVFFPAAALRIIASLAGAFLLLQLRRRMKHSRQQDLVSRTAAIAFILILLGEIAGRWIFYAAFKRIGL
jgi:anaerobic dimethyl sulfoxide reductase subunit C